MIEKTLLTYLNGVLSAPVYMEIPESNSGSEYVVLTKIGGDMVNWIQRATFEILCVSTSLLKAADLCDQVKTAMNEAITLPEISKSRYAGDYNASFTAAKSYRYKAVYEVTYY